MYLETKSLSSQYSCTTLIKFEQRKKQKKDGKLEYNLCFVFNSWWRLIEPMSSWCTCVKYGWFISPWLPCMVWMRVPWNLKSDIGHYSLEYYLRFECAICRFHIYVAGTIARGKNDNWKENDLIEWTPIAPLCHRLRANCKIYLPSIEHMTIHKKIKGNESSSLVNCHKIVPAIRFHVGSWGRLGFTTIIILHLSVMPNGHAKICSSHAVA